MDAAILEKIKRNLAGTDYDFLRNDVNLGSNIILLGLGGSYAYGTYNESSDTDIRGVAVNRAENIVTYTDFNQVVDINTDTTIYSLDKIAKLLYSCNPNCIELLGLDEDQYLKIAPAGRLLLDNRSLFLSQLAVHTFGGYADAQLRRLENKSGRKDLTRQEEHILRSINNSKVHFAERFPDIFKDENAIRLYIDKSEKPELETEIYMDLSLTGYPLRDYAELWGEMTNIVRSYNKIGMRNEKAASHNKLGKHMMHLVRLYLMCFDILERGEIITNRRAEHDMLMDIRNGRYLDDNEQPTAEFYEMLSELEKRLEYDKENTSLPEKPDSQKIAELVGSINLETVKNYKKD